jgi:hypothetical protein
MAFTTFQSYLLNLYTRMPEMAFSTLLFRANIVNTFPEEGTKALIRVPLK